MEFDLSTVASAVAITVSAVVAFLTWRTKNFDSGVAAMQSAVNASVLLNEPLQVQFKQSLAAQAEMELQLKSLEKMLGEARGDFERMERELTALVKIKSAKCETCEKRLTKLFNKWRDIAGKIQAVACGDLRAMCADFDGLLAEVERSHSKDVEGN